jgi:predicted nucleic acid-binding protein
MSDKVFIDSNVLIYAHDMDAGLKHEKAKRILQDFWGTRTGVLSTQVLQEFYVNVTRKIATPLPKATAHLIVSSYFPWCIPITSDDISLAFKVENTTKISFWDSLIVASALKCGASRIISEDLNAGQKILGVHVENPFKAIARH